MSHNWICKFVTLSLFIFSSPVEGDGRDLSNSKGCTLLRSSKGLKLSELKYRDQLNEIEYQKIQKTYVKYFQQRQNPLEWFNEDGLKKIHRDMFGDIWSWGGIYYNGRLRNIGIESSEIPGAMIELCEEVKGYQKASSQLTILEQSARILQKLLHIHPFMNGNGRFARFVSDLYLHSMHGTSPEWPYIDLLNDGEERSKYIKALEKSDLGDYFLLEDLILKYGGRNPSIFGIVENSFFRKNFSRSKRKEFIWNQLYFNYRIDTSYIPDVWLPQNSLGKIFLYLVDLQVSP